MRKFRFVAVVSALALVLGGCGGGESKFSEPGTSPTTPTGPTVATLTVLASTPSIPSDGATPVDISVYARDANNVYLADKSIAITTSSGGLQNIQATTDANGLAKATLTTGNDPSSRAITVTAASGAVTGSVVVNVTGSQLSIQGPSAMVVGQTATYDVKLIDSAGTGISGKAVALTSARGNTLSTASVTTDSQGNGQFNLTIANTGNDTITGTGMGLTATAAVAVNSDAFTFNTPAANTEIPLGTAQTVTVRWAVGGAPVVGQNISFASTRGAVSAPTVATDSTGSASITITSSNAGAATVTATAAGGATAQLPVEFVATTATSIDVQPSVFTLAPGEKSTITATVRDAANNLVKNKTVNFSLQDVTGGSLSTAAAVTDSQGRAQSTYTAGSVPSANQGVHVTGTLQGQAVSDVVDLTVAQRQVFISMGTGNEIEPQTNTTQYAIPYVIQVTDARGAGVANVPLSLSVLSVSYDKGDRNSDAPVNPGDPALWARQVTAGGSDCPDEDLNHNGVLDPGEDLNTSTRIEAGNIASVVPGSISTGPSGFADIKVFYPKNYGEWLTVRLEVRATVAGTEFARQATFVLPLTADDLSSTTVAPPGMVSPFGTGQCGQPN